MKQIFFYSEQFYDQKIFFKEDKALQNKNPQRVKYKKCGKNKGKLGKEEKLEEKLQDIEQNTNENKDINDFNGKIIIKNDKYSVLKQKNEIKQSKYFKESRIIQRIHGQFLNFLRAKRDNHEEISDKKDMIEEFKNTLPSDISLEILKYLETLT